MEEQTTIPKTLLNELMVKCYKMVETNRHYRELVIVDDLNRYGFNLYENQLMGRMWIMLDMSFLWNETEDGVFRIQR